MPSHNICHILEDLRKEAAKLGEKILTGEIGSPMDISLMTDAVRMMVGVLAALNDDGQRPKYLLEIGQRTLRTCDTLPPVAAPPEDDGTILIEEEGRATASEPTQSIKAGFDPKRCGMTRAEIAAARERLQASSARSTTSAT